MSGRGGRGGAGGRGTGIPMAFKCTVAARNRDLWTNALPKGHKVRRTGRTKPRRHGNLGPRTLDTQHEYQCECGHVGWTTHRDILRKPLVESSPQ